MKLVQNNEYLVSTVDNNGTRASVVTVLSMQQCVSSCLWVNHLYAAFISYLNTEKAEVAEIHTHRKQGPPHITMLF